MTKLIYYAGALLLAGAISACSPLSLVNAVSPAGAVEATTALRYGADPRNMLDVYRPAANADKAPVIVFFYGGNWVSGQREDYAFVGRALAARGFVVVVPDYRLYPQVRYPDFLIDGAAAVAWTAREIAGHGGDPAHIFVMGHSAGAYNAAMLALDPRWLGKQGLKPDMLRGWIGLAGPYDFLPVQNRTTQPVFDAPNTPPDSQPISHVGAASPPALLIAANKDNLVNPVRNTGGMAAKLRVVHVPVRELYYDGVTHTTLVASLSNSLKRLAPTLDAVEAFVRSDGGRK
ncbi:MULTISPECIES: alpha/beta hydrolase [unclassified Massilia]|uniref:alpha/beta hydrolase n=1 Tax=unclassified Massilia TaxID=2609279 RepID=UPI001786EBFB|nr:MULTISPECIES: alpha/beta hydrolase [unclassified Massilia]MBD8532518.1 alpha/beta hydrolase [Massilia sp. CFBP 13647]MBD8675889.1 alpha/beta hydrolase [Massilia sp. CFBP 13721]